MNIEGNEETQSTHEEAEQNDEIEGINFGSEKEQKNHINAQKLLREVDEGKSNTLTQKVAIILSKYPETRISDVTLQIKYWREFHNIRGGSVSMEKMYELERLTSLTRARAKIQNEYLLYRSDEKTKRRRKDLQEIEQEKALMDKPSTSTITVYADETGKNQKYLIIGSVWILDSNLNGEMSQRLAEWAGERKGEEHFPRIFHFKDLRGSNRDRLSYYKQFFDQLVDHAGMASFKAIGVDTTKLTMPVEDVLSDLYYRLIETGISQEINQGRIELPRQINYLKEQDSQDTSYKVKLFSDFLIDKFKENYGEELKLNKYTTVEKGTGRMIEQADLIASSLNRKYNVEAETENDKDALSNYIIEKLSINTIRYSVENIHDDISDELKENDRSVFVIYE